MKKLIAILILAAFAIGSAATIEAKPGDRARYLDSKTLAKLKAKANAGKKIRVVVPKRPERHSYWAKRIHNTWQRY